jgi:rubredoxin
MNIIRLTTCENSFEAHMIKNRLENDGIESFLTNENFSSLMPNYNRIFGSGVQVMIFEKDLPLASEILGLNKKTEIICPACGSRNISLTLGKNAIRKFFIIILSLFMATPFNNINNSCVCGDCGERF